MNARLYKLNKNPLQSGIAKDILWIMELIEENGDTKEKNINNEEVPITSRKLTFNNKNSALMYAKKMDIKCKIIDPSEEEFKIKCYNKNFL